MMFRRSDPAPLPLLDAPVAVVGDLHGRCDLLEAMLAHLAARPDASALRVIFAGDMVDRGPDSAGVLRRLQALEQAPAPFAQVVCLMGNHDRMLLDFLEAPAQAGPRWLRAGGEATLESFGLRAAPAPRADAPQARLERLAAAFRAELGPLHPWLAGLALRWSEAELWVTHAGADPRRDPAGQGDDACLWGDPRFYKGARRDGLWVAHGHRVVETAFAAGGRIAVDTGAWRTGRLTAAVLAEGAVAFVSTDGPGTILAPGRQA